MSKAQARKRLMEAQKKIVAVYFSQTYAGNPPLQAVTIADMAAFEKLFNKCLKRIQ
jgi:hypothetical protein